MRIVDVLERDAELYPDRVAVVLADDRSVTFAELTDRVRRIAAGFKSLGIKRGSRVVLVADDGAVFFDVYLAVAYLGAIAVPINTRLTDREIEFIIDNAQPMLTIADSGYVERLGVMRGVDLVIDSDSPAYEELASSDPLPDLGQASEDDVALIIYTSGTTGQPKGVCLTQRALIFNGLTMAIVQQFQPDDVFLSATPLFHAASGTRVSSMLVDGQTHVVLGKFTPKSFFELVQKYKVTVTVLVPTQLRLIIEDPEFSSYDLSSLRLIVYGAAPSGGELIRKAQEKFGCGLYQGYGISECVTNLTGLLPSDHDSALHNRPDLLASCGRVVPGVRIELRNGQGTPVSVGEVGEIWVQTEKMMTGYWRDPAQTAEAIVDGWFRTGDLARSDEDGYLFIVGRSKDMLISGGVNVYPSEIELVLHDHPAVIESSVIGRPDSKWGERPVAFVKLNRQVDEGELRTWCDERLAAFKVPSEFFLVDEFPRTVTGKIRKVELRKMAS
tara:strand:- start:5942 stop:7438 length:1497 start_codon:yes stop_codon:yes gene_type:complete